MITSVDRCMLTTVIIPVCSVIFHVIFRSLFVFTVLSFQKCHEKLCQYYFMQIYVLMTSITDLIKALCMQINKLISLK